MIGHFNQSEHRNLVTLSKQITSINLVYFDILFYQKFVQRYNNYKTNLEGGTLSCINPNIRLGISLILGLILDLVLPSQLVLYMYHLSGVSDYYAQCIGMQRAKSVL